MEFKKYFDDLHKSPASNNTFNMDDEEAFGTGPFTVDERGEMLCEGDTPSNAPAPCTAKCLDGESSMTARLTNDFVHVPHNPVTPRHVVGHCKLYCLAIIIALSLMLNIVLVTVGVWYVVTSSPQPPGVRPTPTPQVPITNSRKFLVIPGEVDNLVAVPCNARANLAERFPGMVREYVNVSSVYPEKPIQQYCYLPKSEQLNHLLRIINLASKSVNGSLGVQRRHCVSIAYPTVNGSDVKYHWSERGENGPDNIFKISRDTRTSELELRGPSGFYLIMATTVYRSTVDISPTRVSMEARVNGRKVIGQSKTLFPSDDGFISLSFHDVVHINQGNDVTFNASPAKYLYQVRTGAHNAYMCCIPVLGGCRR